MPLFYHEMRSGTMPAYKDEKTGKWYTIFRYEAYDGKRKQKMKRGFDRKKDALDYERDFLTRMEGSPNITFKQLYKEYMEDAESRLRITTIESKRNMIETKILPFFKDKPINEINARAVRKWQNWMLKQKKPNGELYADTYIKSINNQLSAMFNYAVKFFNLPANPIHKTGAIGKKHADEMNFWTLDEFEHCMTYFDADDPHDFQFLTFYYLLFYTGMRQGEASALTLNDINFEDKTVRVDKTFVRIDGKDMIHETKTPKSKRTIHLPDIVLEMLSVYIESLYDYNSEDILFPMHKSSINRRLKTAIKNTNSPMIRVHDLRHSHASFLIELGCNVLLIQERLGHENVETTMQTYAHLYPNKQEEVINKVNNMLSNRYHNGNKNTTNLVK